MVARYGGDEFIVILPDTNIEGVQTIVNKMKKYISELNIENAYSPYGKLTVSIGAAEHMPEKESHWKNFVAVVDKALYKAKQNGKNQVALL
jgi:diguanylate cyclase (GGDEF)-like protein